MGSPNMSHQPDLTNPQTQESGPNSKSDQDTFRKSLRLLNRLGLVIWLVEPVIRCEMSAIDFYSPLFFKILSLLILLPAGLNLLLARQKLKGTSLRPATLWAFLCLFFCMIGVILDDCSVAGRSVLGIFSHLAFLATLASLVSVLGARRPGEMAWAVLCGLFLLIGLLPLLEGVSLSRKFDILDYLRFDSPWTYFIALVIFAGISNYLPTRFFPSSVILGFGLLQHLRLLWKPEGRSEWRGEYWWILIWSISGSLIIGYFAAVRGRIHQDRDEFEKLWFSFRDAWGAAWALRVLERFNQSCISNRWNTRLNWFGLYSVAENSDANSDEDQDQENQDKADLTQADLHRMTVKTLEVFVRRFGELEKIRGL